MIIAVDRGRDQAVLSALESIYGVLDPQNQTHSYITQLSSPLRFLLIHSELQKSASTHGITIRTGKTLDLGIKTVENTDIIFGMTGVGVIHGVNIDGFLWAHNQPPKEISWIPLSPPEDPNSCETMSLSEFINQQVLAIPNCVISRRQLVHYAANKMGVSHYDANRGKNNDIGIDKTKASLWIKIEDKKPMIHFNSHSSHLDKSDLHIEERKFDCVILQLFSTAFMLNLSLDIINFRNYLAKYN